MAGELQYSFSAGKTAYALIRNRIGQIWNTSGGTGAFEAYQTSVYSSYAISVVEQGTASAFYVGNAPAALPAGTYGITGKQQIAGSVAESDPTVAVGNFEWNGTVAIPLSDLATSGQIGLLAPLKIARGMMIQNFQFDLVSSADHVTPFVSGVISGQIRRDNGSFGPLQSGTFTEGGLGFFSVTLTSGDLLANTAALVFTAAGVSGGTSDPRRFSFVMQRTSGQT